MSFFDWIASIMTHKRRKIVSYKTALPHAALSNSRNMPFGGFHGKQVSLGLDRGCVHLLCHMTGKE